MKNQNLFLFIIITIVAVGGVFLLTKNKNREQSASTNQEKPAMTTKLIMTTAKKAYLAALSEAKKFSPDSYLVSIRDNSVQKNGQAKVWYVTFYSPAKNTNLRVTIYKGKVDRTEERSRGEKNPVSNNWVDSDLVAKIAIPKCGQINQTKFFFDLESANDRKRTEWRVACEYDIQKVLWIYVDAQTGEVSRTIKAGRDW